MDCKPSPLWPCTRPGSCRCGAHRPFVPFRPCRVPTPTTARILIRRSSNTRQTPLVDGPSVSVVAYCFSRPRLGTDKFDSIIRMSGMRSGCQRDEHAGRSNHGHDWKLGCLHPVGSSRRERRHAGDAGSPVEGEILQPAAHGVLRGELPAGTSCPASRFPLFQSPPSCCNIVLQGYCCRRAAFRLLRRVVHP